MGNVHLLFDGDILAYRAGFAAERRVYFDGRLPERGASFDSKKEALKNLPEEHIEWERELQPVEHALENCKSLIRNISNEMALHFDARVSYICFLTGNSEVPNFRKKVDPDVKLERNIFSFSSPKEFMNHIEDSFFTRQTNVYRVNITRPKPKLVVNNDKKSEGV